MDSILTSVKKYLGMAEEYEPFDDDIIIHINTVFSALTQIGVGPSEGFRISDETAEWDDFIPADNLKLEMVKDYVNLKVKLIFDPPASNAVIESFNRAIAEIEWRLSVAVSPQSE